MLLSPYTVQDRLAVVYILSYGGGLVGGDQIKLAVDIGSSAILVLVSQGSTKVFKSRPEQRMSSVRPLSLITTQNLVFNITGTLFLLPDPVTCFRSASYSQIQTFHVSSHSSLILLDWVTSGRKSLGEDWSFARYYSMNEVFVDGKRLIKDVTLLEADPLSEKGLTSKLAPYSCYANLILLGPIAQDIIKGLVDSYGRISIMQAARPPDLLWSLSQVDSGSAVVRVAGKDTEAVKNWLADVLIPVERVMGVDLYRRTLR